MARTKNSKQHEIKQRLKLTIQIGRIIHLQNEIAGFEAFQQRLRERGRPPPGFTRHGLEILKTSLEVALGHAVCGEDFGARPGVLCVVDQV